MDDRLVLLLLLLFFFKPFLGSIVVAAIFAIMFYPLYQKKPGYLSAAAITLCCLLLTIFLGYHISFYLYDQVNYIVGIFNSFSPELQLQIMNAGSQVQVYDFAYNLLTSIPSIAVKFLMTFIATFYFLKDGHKIKDALRNIFPPRKANALVKEGSNNLKAIVLGVFVSTFFYTFFGTIVLYLTNTPMALVYALVAGLFGPVPIVTGSMVYLWIIIQKIMAGDFTGALIVFSFIAIWQLIGDVYFRIKYRGTLHPAFLLFSMFAGLWLFGFAGIVVGPVLASLAHTWIVVENKI